MDATTTANGTATTKAAKFRPIRLACPHCGALPEAGEPGLAFGLGDGKVRCPECSEAVGRADLELVIDEARRLIRFLDLAATI